MIQQDIRQLDNHNFSSNKHTTPHSTLLTDKGVEGVHVSKLFCGNAKIPEGVRKVTGINERWRKSFENRVVCTPHHPLR